jgi:hypothetical protein
VRTAILLVLLSAGDPEMIPLGAFDEGRAACLAAVPAVWERLPEAVAFDCREVMYAPLAAIRPVARGEVMPPEMETNR